MTSIIKQPNAIVNAAVRSIMNTIVDTITSATDKTNTSLTKQRMVSATLGKNITKDHATIYNEIEKRIGAHCYYNWRRWTTGVLQGLFNSS